MLSKLIPGGTGVEMHPYAFRVIGAETVPRDPSLPPERRAKPPAVDREIAELREQVESLKKELETKVAAAREAGLKEGETRARTRADATMRPVVDRMNASIQEMVSYKPRLRKEVEEEAVRLSLAIARRILRRELNVDASALRALLQVALERAGRQEITRLIVNPAQAEQARGVIPQITGIRIEVVPDGSREIGTVILETTRESIDASVESQLQEIELGLADRLRWN